MAFGCMLGAHLVHCLVQIFCKRLQVCHMSRGVASFFKTSKEFEIPWASPRPVDHIHKDAHNRRAKTKIRSNYYPKRH